VQPFNWVPLEFTSMLFSHGIRPRIDEFAAGLGIDRSRFRNDHALDDARFLREVYLRATAGKPDERRSRTTPSPAG